MNLSNLSKVDIYVDINVNPLSEANQTTILCITAGCMKAYLQLYEKVSSSF